MISIFRRQIQNLAILTIRPYVVRELRGWGRIYNFFASYRRDWLWRGAPVKTIHDKNYGLIMHLDLSKWSDRSNFFLARWYDLEIQLFMADIICLGDTVVDIGANRGEFSLIASCLVGTEGKVISFEPNPNCLKIFDQEIAANRIQNVTVQRFALGMSEEELMLSVPILQTYYGTFSRSAFAAEETYDVKTPVKRGDETLANENPTLIKIDVEGFECNVLAGLTRTVARCHPIIITEVVPRNLEACGFSVSELARIMQNYGYEGFKLSLTREPGYLTWGITKFDMKERDYDAVWIHPASNLESVTVATRHIINSQL